jgi:transcriptional regulator with XRE-family HTH domain
MKPTREKPSDRVRRAVADSGLSNCQICRAAGLNEAVLSRFMAGTRGLSLATLDALAPVLGLEVVARGMPKAPPRRRPGRKPKRKEGGKS